MVYIVILYLQSNIIREMHMGPLLSMIPFVTAAVAAEGAYSALKTHNPDAVALYGTLVVVAMVCGVVLMFSRAK